MHSELPKRTARRPSLPAEDAAEWQLYPSWHCAGSAPPTRVPCVSLIINDEKPGIHMSLYAVVNGSQAPS